MPVTTMTTMRSVSKAVFYSDPAAMGDVELRVEGEYPYTTRFINKRTRAEVGRIVDTYTDGEKNRYPIVSTYYLPGMP